ncbi:flagella synthesis protein FlgN [Paraburkholderia caballeronis]|uniref:Flagella synthesis protein FlgN n=1 Tax=Paraburkholderia caballeronis TaxID=416943 RepID=A0A1H7SP85_9BURK|nr:flagellar protein FlgN [Paraburkholderia caballeronis]PXW22380.1 flagella synthesis protein FlgN [Paraburkholderia caballeronis]PXW96038.1 flagella synthesis protein FlgN [Paraburkholderia caballeronis]RAJ92404.1 flagella synthesis protein FlgN [Paraburkholderia caballeronis]TDV08051.1 flagella synthesis protein FlgN [Paraburkholderia caballeronis]TDV11885.1 flagella synthesis protein FlgN [Paraburkholderia caballeronis]
MKDALLATLIDEHATVEAFASLLAYEEKALASNDALASLPSIVEQKTELTQRLAQLEKVRDAQLTGLGLPRGRKGIEMACAGDARLSGQWALLKGSTDRARRANLLVGMMVNTRMEHNRRALAILRSESRGGGNSMLYGPDGRLPAFGA